MLPATGTTSYGLRRVTSDQAATAAAPIAANRFVVMHVLQAPQHACAAGAKSAALFKTGSALVGTRGAIPEG